MGKHGFYIEQWLKRRKHLKKWMVQILITAVLRLKSHLKKDLYLQIRQISQLIINSKVSNLLFNLKRINNHKSFP